MKLFRITFAIVSTVLPAMFATQPAFAAFAMVAPPGTTTPFQVTDATQVPGKTLKPGSYSITVVDHLTDRMVLRVLGSDGKEEATFLAVPAANGFSGSPGSGPVDMKGGSKKRTALRGFRFPDGTSAEFVYPKAEAVSLAKANGTTVPAIDPASEGRVDASKLSRSDMELVTLWMLTPTVVGQQAAIQAERYQPAVASAAVPAAPTAPSETSTNRTDVRPMEARAVTPPKPAPVRTNPTMKALPHTASSEPLILLIGVLALLGAAMLGVGRRRLSW